MKVYNKISLNRCNLCYFKIQYSTISAKFIERSSCWQMQTTE